MPNQKPVAKRRRKRLPEKRLLPSDQAEFRIAENGDTKTVTGYAALYNTRSVDLGGFEEVLEPGCFDSVMETNPDVFALFNHDPDSILARSTSGTLKLSLDEKGLAYSFEMPDTTLGNDLSVLMKRGDIRGSSFAFVTGKAEFRSDDSGKSVRYISNIASLHDVAVVSTPAYPKAGAAIRSFKRWQKKQVEAQLDKTVPVELQSRLSVLRQQARRSSF